MASLTETSALEPNPFLGCVLRFQDDVDHHASLRIRGELCAVTAGEHARQLGDLVDQGYIQLRIELDDLVLCTSDGLDLWDDLQHRLEPLSGRLTLSGANGVVRRVLDIVCAGDQHFCPTVERSAA
jgi:anti-anti-sigma regulatory factor